jgi:voltage-gated potassium channel Kch
MKSLGFILSYLATPPARRSVRILSWMLGIFVVAVGAYSAVIHQIMGYEGQRHTWPTAVYWTVVTMSTLGYGDIAFESDLGRTFSVVVLLSGSAFILVLLPFTFIQFVFVPWMDSTQRARAPRRLGDEVDGHVILTALGPIEEALIERLRRLGTPYVVIISDLEEALRMHDEDYDVMVGEMDDPAAFRAARVERSVLVATLGDTTNTNIAFTVREISDSVAIVATANAEASVDILPDGRTHVVGAHARCELPKTVARRLSAAKVCDKPRLFWRFDRLLAVGTPSPGDRLGRWHAAESGKTGQRSSGAPVGAQAAHLDVFAAARSVEYMYQLVAKFIGAGGYAEVGPLDMVMRPRW